MGFRQFQQTEKARHHGCSFKPPGARAVGQAPSRGKDFLKQPCDFHWGQSPPTAMRSYRQQKALSFLRREGFGKIHSVGRPQLEALLLQALFNKRGRRVVLILAFRLGKAF